MTAHLFSSVFSYHVLVCWVTITLEIEHVTMHSSASVHKTCCCHRDERPIRENKQKDKRRWCEGLPCCLNTWQGDGLMQHRLVWTVWFNSVTQSHTQELQMQSKLISKPHQYSILTWAGVGKLPASSCSAVVKPNTNSTVIEAKCLLSGPWLVPCSPLARCQFWTSFHPSSCQTCRHTSTAAAGYYITNPCYPFYCHRTCLNTTHLWR